MQLCDYGCEKEGIYQFKNGKYCCSPHWTGCKKHRKYLSEKFSGDGNPRFGQTLTTETKQKIRMKAIGRTPWNKGKPRSISTKNKLKKKLKGKVPWNKGIKDFSNRRTIKKIKEKYSLFSKIEKMRYNPNKPGEKEIQVHCKNHLCKNSKEIDGWFTPTGRQIEARIASIENKGLDNSYFYCSDECKNKCPLYGLQNDPFSKSKENQYTSEEYQTFRGNVLKRDNNTCQFCGELAEDVHHERPQKLEPFFSLDPDFAWSCCKKCHYKRGHQDECSTGRLASKICA